MPLVIAGLVAKRAVGHDDVAGELLVQEIGIGNLFSRGQSAQPGGIGRGAQIPKIGGDEDHVNGGALGHGELAGVADVVEQLAGGADGDVGFAVVFENGDGEGGDDGDDRNHGEHLDEGEPEDAPAPGCMP